MRFELWQDGVCVAAVEADSELDCKREIQHYAAVYGQDGPVEIKGPMAELEPEEEEEPPCPGE